jgi:Cu/Ag efflux protein CusF
MKLRLLITVLALASVAAPVVHAADKPAETAPAAIKRHPLRGVITAVDAEKSALRVKHEAIPGVMGAMTMQFKVDAAAVKAAKVGDAITALMSRQGNSWVLEDIKPAPAK